MHSFELHPQLNADYHPIGWLNNCRVLLHHNAGVPWYILVPATGAGELHEMGSAERSELEQALDTMAGFIKHHHGSERVNIGAIGNRVPQLHVHVIGRHQHDPCWPDAVWGHLPPGPEWDAATLATIRREAPISDNSPHRE